MHTKVFYTADATSDVPSRLERAVQDARNRSGHARMRQLDEVQKRVEQLRQRGFLKRQEYAAPTTADFQKLFMSKSQS